MHHELAEAVLKAADILITLRRDGGVGWHPVHRRNAETQFYQALNDYAAFHAAGADPKVWKDSVNRAREQMKASKQ